MTCNTSVATLARQMVKNYERGAAGPSARDRSTRRQQRDELEELMQERAHNDGAKGAGPRAALSKAHLEVKTANELTEWVESARLDAVLGSCARSLPSLRSGIRCYIAFAGASRQVLVFHRNRHIAHRVRFTAAVCETEVSAT